MALPTLPGDEKRDEKLNPGQQDYDRRFNDIAKAEEQGTFNDIANNYDQKADGSRENKNISKLQERESEGDTEASSGFKSNYTGTGAKKSKVKGALKFAKKRGGIIGLIAALGVGGGLLAGFFGPASMLINLAENATLKNDTSTTSMERRFMKVFGFATSGDPVCANSTKSTLKCKMGSISNRSLNQLEKKGLTPVFTDDVDNNNRKKTGYPTKNPTGYTVDLKDGNKPETVKAADLTKYLADHPKVAAKVLGTGGAFNIRVQAWTGKHITQKLYDKFGLKRDGGIASSSNKRLTPTERLAEATKKLTERIPGVEKMNTVADSIDGKIRTRMNTASKGGTAYMTAVAGCIAVKAPGFIAAGVAGVQLAQVMPFGMDVVLSPGSQQKASGVDVANSITAEGVENSATLLTNKTAREGDGKMTSALDSPYLQSAIGVNKNKTPVSKNFTPGYSVLTSPLVRTGAAADKASEPLCNGIMSPAAMYTAMAVDGAVTIALSTTVIGGIVKIAAGFVISEVVTQVASAIGKEAAKAVITDLAKNDKIESAKGEALGDVVGISMASMFSAGGMARNLPTLKESEVAGFETARLENEAFKKDMDIASLSPFDTSSRYTFLGSIANNARLAVLASGSYNGSLLSSLPGILNFSRAAFSVNTNAADFSQEYCGYAKDFGMEAEKEADTPAINMAGLPCTGLTGGQINMGTEEAIDLITGEGWLDESKTIEDTDSIQDLITKGYIKTETPLFDFIEACSNAESGDYVINSAGCTVPTVGGGTDAELPPLKNPRSLEAMSVFLLDYQQYQMINGNDIGDTSTNPTTTAGSTDKKALAQKIIAKGKIKYLTNAKPLLESYADGSVDPNSEPCGVNINVLRMIDAVTDQHSITISSLNRHCINRITGSGPASRHYNGNGSAFDISSVDGRASSGRDAGSMAVISIVMPILSEAAKAGGKQSNVGQVNCGGMPALAEGVKAIQDSCNHLHLDVPPESDPSLKFTPN
jgi:hypothetical protein